MLSSLSNPAAFVTSAAGFRDSQGVKGGALDGHGGRDVTARQIMGTIDLIFSKA